MAAVLAVDGGGTATRCLVVSGEGEIVASESGPPCALSAGSEESLAVLGGIVRRATLAAASAWSRAHSEAFTLSAACLGLSGAATMGLAPQVAAVVQGELQSVGQSLARERVLVVSDTRIAHEAALGGQPGVVLIVGTGAVGYGRTAGGAEARADGWGWLLGDAGSGYAIGVEALRAAFAAVDGRGKPTLLTEAVLKHFAASDLTAVAKAVYGGAVERRHIAVLAARVVELMLVGDAVAGAIIDRAAQALADTVLAVVNRMDWDASPIPVSTAGGLIRNAACLEERVRYLVTQQDRRCRFLPPQGEPVEGAVRLARAVAESAVDGILRGGTEHA